MTFGSVYEITNPLSTVAKQHFVDWFSGADLDTKRWNKHNVSGTGTFAMEDNANSGFKVKAGNGNNEESELDFNNIRPYSQTGSIIIMVTKAVNSGNGYWTNNWGFTNTQGLGNDYACIQNQDSDPYFSLISKDTSFNRTNSSMLIDLGWHNHKLECTSSNLIYTLDGLLEVSKTANRPTAVLQPVFNIQTQSADDDGGEGLIRYCEAWNT